MSKKKHTAKEAKPIPGGIVAQGAARYGDFIFLRSALQILFPGYGPVVGTIGSHIANG